MFLCLPLHFYFFSLQTKTRVLVLFLLTLGTLEQLLFHELSVLDPTAECRRCQFKLNSSVGPVSTLNKPTATLRCSAVSFTRLEIVNSMNQRLFNVQRPSVKSGCYGCKARVVTQREQNLRHTLILETTTVAPKRCRQHMRQFPTEMNIADLLQFSADRGAVSQTYASHGGRRSLSVVYSLKVLLVYLE